MNCFKNYMDFYEDMGCNNLTNKKEGKSYSITTE